MVSTFAYPNLSTLSHCTQVHDLHLYGSAVDSALRDSTWEVQTYVHFQDNEGVTVIIKPEHRVEDVLALACKVVNFAVDILLSREGLLMVHSSAFSFVGVFKTRLFIQGNILTSMLTLHPSEE